MLLSFSISPPNAVVMLDGEVIGRSVRLPADGKARVLTVSAQGYAPVRRELKVTGAMTVNVRLDRIRRSR